MPVAYHKIDRLSLLLLLLYLFMLCAPEQTLKTELHFLPSGICKFAFSNGSFNKEDIMGFPEGISVNYSMSSDHFTSTSIFI